MYLLLYISIYLFFIAVRWTLTQSVLKPFAHNPASGVKQMERHRKCRLDGEMENTFIFEMIIPPDAQTNRPLLPLRQFLLI